MRLIDETHLRLPFYGSRRIRDELEEQGHWVNRKRMQRLMRQMGLRALYPKPRTSRPGQGHKIYPYLLQGLSIERPNQVWATDICYIPMAKGFMYLVAIMDWATRRVLSWRVSNTMDSEFCVEALEEALQRYGTPEIFDEQTMGTMSRMKLEVVNLGGFGDLKPAQLSGGMIKRAALARAIVMDPKLLFFDEPSAGLDPVVAAELDDLILKLRESMQMTIVVVTHELDSAFKIADRITVLDHGKILLMGTVDEVRNTDNERVQDLLNRRPRDEARSGPRILDSVLSEISTVFQAACVTIVEIEIAGEADTQRGRRRVGAQVDILVLHAAPQAFYEDVVEPAPLAIHTDRHPMRLEHIGERRGGELRALVGVEDLRRPVPSQRLLKCLDTQVTVQRVRYLPREHPARVPVHHCDQIHETPRHWDIADGRRPDLVRPFDRDVLEQVRVDLVAMTRHARARLRIERCQSHLAHQSLYPLTIDPMPARLQFVSPPTATVERQLKVDLVDQTHQRQVCLRHWARAVVRRRARDLEQFTAPGDRQRMLAHNHLTALAQRSPPSALDKKSFAIVS